MISLDLGVRVSLKGVKHTNKQRKTLFKKKSNSCQNVTFMRTHSETLWFNTKRNKQLFSIFILIYRLTAPNSMFTGEEMVEIS